MIKTNGITLVNYCDGILKLMKIWLKLSISDEHIDQNRIKTMIILLSLIIQFLFPNNAPISKWWVYFTQWLRLHLFLYSFYICLASFLTCWSLFYINLFYIIAIFSSLYTFFCHQGFVVRPHRSLLCEDRMISYHRYYSILIGKVQIHFHSVIFTDSIELHSLPKNSMKTCSKSSSHLLILSLNMLLIFVFNWIIVYLFFQLKLLMIEDCLDVVNLIIAQMVQFRTIYVRL